jgi:hypothetical protein
MTTLAFEDELTLTRFGIRLTQVHDELWRVTKPHGEVLGYIERFAVQAGLRYRAKRFIARQRRFVVMGEFWSVDDAIEVFRG